ncbi:hypothetical protein, partial [Corallococcus exiguus]|uniref:hypothetical protein n=1 Tax=Corallococcus exiguus TaxID=83462 RepID=UPI001C2521A0
MSEHADIDGVVRAAMAAWKPPPRLSLSEWADRYFHLSAESAESAESAAEPGRWRSLPYQRGIMDAFTDPTTVITAVEAGSRSRRTRPLRPVASRMQVPLASLRGGPHACGR